MIVNGNLPDFACNVISKGQITLGDVRRLQRNYLPGGITKREELEILISLNAKLARADKVWAQWLVSAVAEFVKRRESCERSFEDATGKWVQHLLSAPATKLGLRIARQIRRELSRLQAIHSTGESVQASDVQQRHQVGVPEWGPDDSLQKQTASITTKEHLGRQPQLWVMCSDRRVRRSCDPKAELFRCYAKTIHENLWTLDIGHIGFQYSNRFEIQQPQSQ
jgi:hypothetical protein